MKASWTVAPNADPQMRLQPTGTLFSSELVYRLSLQAEQRGKNAAGTQVCASASLILLANLGESDETARQQVHCAQFRIGEHS